MAESSVFMDLKKMEALIESLKTKAVIEVGVFSDKAGRKEDELNNAELAMYHEYGSPKHNLPARSMLKVPIGDHIQDIIAVMKGKADAYLAKGTLLNLYKLVGIKCENVVLGAFQSGGYGKWAPLKYSTLLGKFKGNLKARKGKLAQIYAGEVGQAILVRTAQLKRSFSSRVKMSF